MNKLRVEQLVRTAAGLLRFVTLVAQECVVEMGPLPVRAARG